MFGKELFLPLEGARIYLRFFGLQKDEIMEFGWKSSFNVGDDCKTGKCFLINLLIDGKLGLNVSTKGKIFLEFLVLGLKRLCHCSPVHFV